MKIITTGRPAIILGLASGTTISQSAAPCDAQIAGIVAAANTVGIHAGTLAEPQCGNEKVRQFARRMVTDPTAVGKQAGAQPHARLRQAEPAPFRPGCAACGQRCRGNAIIPAN